MNYISFKLYIIFFFFLASSRDLNETPYDECGVTSGCENVVIVYCVLRLSPTHYIDPSLFVDHLHSYKLVGCEIVCENRYVCNIVESFES